MKGAFIVGEVQATHQQNVQLSLMVEASTPLVQVVRRLRSDICHCGRRDKVPLTTNADRTESPNRVPAKAALASKLSSVERGVPPWERVPTGDQ